MYVIKKIFYRSLIKDTNTLAEVDGYATWREREANSLSDLLQRRLKSLQNPPDCANARKLVCKLNKVNNVHWLFYYFFTIFFFQGCGYGCQLHHAVYCLIVAYGTQRTLILKSKGWKYNKGGWEDIFKPVSDTCLDSVGKTEGLWPGI